MGVYLDDRLRNQKAYISNLRGRLAGWSEEDGIRAFRALEDDLQDALWELDELESSF